MESITICHITIAMIFLWNIISKLHDNNPKDHPLGLFFILNYKLFQMRWHPVLMALVSFPLALLYSSLWPVTFIIETLVRRKQREASIQPVSPVYLANKGFIRNEEDEKIIFTLHLDNYTQIQVAMLKDNGFNTQTLYVRRKSRGLLQEYYVTKPFYLTRDDLYQTCNKAGIGISKIDFWAN